MARLWIVAPPNVDWQLAAVLLPIGAAAVLYLSSAPTWAAVAVSDPLLAKAKPLMLLSAFFMIGLGAAIFGYQRRDH